MNIIFTDTKSIIGIIGDGIENNGKEVWEILERIIGKIKSIIGSGLSLVMLRLYCAICIYVHRYLTVNIIGLHFCPVDWPLT